MKVVKGKNRNGSEFIKEYIWEEADNTRLRELWMSNEHSKRDVAEALGVSLYEVECQRKHIGLPKKIRKKSTLLKERPELEQIIRDRYPDHPDLAAFADELGITHNDLVQAAATLKVRRKVRQVYESRLKERMEEHQQIMDGAKEMLESVGLGGEVKDLTENTYWPLPGDFARMELRHYINYLMGKRYHDDDGKEIYQNKTYSHDIEYDLYTIRDDQDNFIAFVKVPSRSNIKNFTDNDEKKHRRMIEIRALSMVVPLPFMNWHAVDSEGFTILTRTPSDYFKDERHRLRHEARLAFWRLGNVDSRYKGYKQLSMIIPRLRKLNAEAGISDELAQAISDIHEEQQADERAQNISDTFNRLQQAMEEELGLTIEQQGGNSTPAPQTANATT